MARITLVSLLPRTRHCWTDRRLRRLLSFSLPAIPRQCLMAAFRSGIFWAWKATDRPLESLNGCSPGTCPPARPRYPDFGRSRGRLRHFIGCARHPPAPSPNKPMRDRGFKCKPRDVAEGNGPFFNAISRHASWLPRWGVQSETG